MMLPAPAVAWLVPAAGACGDAFGLRVPGGTPGDATGPSTALLAPRLETSGSPILAWGQAMPLGCAWGRALFPWQAPNALGAPLGAGSSTVLRYHPAWWGPRGGKQAEGAPSTHRAPQTVMPRLCPTCFLPSVASCIPPCKPPTPACSPGLPQTAAVLPLIPGGSQQVPQAGTVVVGRGCVCCPPQRRHRRRRFAAALPAPGWELAPAGVAD